MRFRFAVALASVFLFATHAFAADPARVTISLVEEQAGQIKVTLSATGTDGKPVAVSASTLKATLDGTPLNVASVQQTTATSRGSTGIVLLVDTSGSMNGEPIAQVKRALFDFVDTLGADDSIAMLSFDTTVKHLVEIGADRATISQAVNQLNARGDSALYDGVIEATNKAASMPAERKLIALLSDGENNINNQKRAASIEAARAAGVPIIVIVLGSRIDLPYLTEVIGTSGGRLIEAQDPAALRKAYSDLAVSIRTQQVVSLTVPGRFDRTVTSKLSLRFTIDSDVSVVERDLPPLAGATPPPFELTLGGFKAAERLKAPTALKPNFPEGVQPASVQYSVDGGDTATVTTPPFELPIDPAQFMPGAHLIKVVALDVRGRKGEAQIPFVVPPPAKPPMHIPVMPILLVVTLAGLAGGGYYIFQKRRPGPETYASRVKPWRGSVAGAVASIPEFERPEEPAPPPVVDTGPLGRVIVMNEAKIKSGQLDGIREYEVGHSPLTLGSGRHSDIVLEGDESIVAAEEARLWVQRNRLVYHKLTTLSAMATEGVTSGWIFLEDGEEMTIGSYRLAYRVDVPEAVPEPALAPRDPPSRLPELWPREDSGGQLRPFSE